MTAGLPVACIDVGGTTIKAGLLDDGGLRELRQEPTPPAGPGVAGAVLDAATRLVGELGRAGEVRAVGFVVPGLVDTVAGVAGWSENLGWRDVPFRDLLAERTGLPVAFGHDVRAGALAEARLGAGRGHADVLFLPIGTGIAAGIVLDEQVLERSRPVGEVGHVDVGHGEPCVCGRRGCLEAVSSAAAVARRYRARTGRPASAADIAQRVAAGDPDATAVWQDAVAGLGDAIAWCAGVLAPEVVVVGGGLARAGDLLLEPLRADVADRLTFQHLPEIVPAALGDRAGCIGAGLLARELVGAAR